LLVFAETLKIDPHGDSQYHHTFQKNSSETATVEVKDRHKSHDGENPWRRDPIDSVQGGGFVDGGKINLAGTWRKANATRSLPYM
jgi:predicted ATP-dependent serine protease